MLGMKAQKLNEISGQAPPPPKKKGEAKLWNHENFTLIVKKNSLKYLSGQVSYKTFTK